MKTEHWIGIAAAIAAVGVAVYVMRDKLFPAAAHPVSPNSNTSSNAGGAAAQLAGRAGTAKTSGTQPTYQQQVAQYGQSSPNGTLQTVGQSIAIANQGLGLFNNLRELFPDLEGDSGEDIDPSAVAGNWSERYSAEGSLMLDEGEFVESWSE